MQPVRVEEPSVQETIEILKGLQPRYEDYHHVKYTDDAIKQQLSFQIVTFKTASYRIKPLIC